MAVGSYSKNVTVDMQVEATPDYTSGDIMGEKQQLSEVFRYKGLGAVLQSVVVHDAAKQELDFDILFFDQDVTAAADNAAEAFSAADMKNCLGVVRIVAADYVTFANASMATKAAIGLHLKAGRVSGDTKKDTKDLWVVCVARGAHNFAAVTDLQIKFGFLQD